MIITIIARFMRADMRIVWLAFLLMYFSGLSEAAERPIVGVASVVDGDTISIGSVRIRLYGIDAPEGDQLCFRTNGAPWRCGDQSALALTRLVAQAPLRCDPRGQDRYHRVIAVCFKGNQDINRSMVSSGRAVAFRQYSSAYVADEGLARGAKLGIWAGTFQMPWDWRAAKAKR